MTPSGREVVLREIIDLHQRTARYHAVVLTECVVFVVVGTLTGWVLGTVIGIVGVLAVAVSLGAVARDL